MAKRRKPVSTQKAKEIMKHGTVHGEKLTKKQKGFFGLIAGGMPLKGRMS